MKRLLATIGLLFVVGGGILLYDGYQQRNSVVSNIERGVDNVVRWVTRDQGKYDGSVNKEANLKMIGGVVLLILGMGFTAIGQKK